jgi:hypothetical protein
MVRGIAAGAAATCAAIGRAIPDALREVSLFAGAGLVAYGVYLINEPAGIITGGVELIAGSLLASVRPR